MSRQYTNGFLGEHRQNSTYAQAGTIQRIRYWSRTLTTGIIASVKAVAIAPRTTGLWLAGATFARPGVLFRSHLGRRSVSEAANIERLAYIVCGDFASADVVARIDWTRSAVGASVAPWRRTVDQYGLWFLMLRAVYARQDGTLTANHSIYPMHLPG